MQAAIDTFGKASAEVSELRKAIANVKNGDYSGITMQYSAQNRKTTGMNGHVAIHPSMPVHLYN